MPLPADAIAEIVLGQPIPEGKLALFRARFKDRLFEVITRELNRQEMAGETSIAEVGVRIGKGAEEFDHLLATPDAWRLDDYVDVVLALFGAELVVDTVPVTKSDAKGLDAPTKPLEPLSS